MIGIGFPQQELIATIERACDFLGSETTIRLSSGKFARSKLCYHLSGGKVSLSLLAALEIAHAATLFHDDVIDGDEKRRGMETLHRIKNNKWAILEGDLSLVTAIQLVFASEDEFVSNAFVESIAETCRGEIMQQRLMSAADYGFTGYYETVLRKTGSFFGFAALSAAWYRALGEEGAREYYSLFRELGALYQMMDDLEDCFIEEEALSDHANNNLTLPYVLLMEHAPESNFLNISLDEKRKLLESYQIVSKCQSYIDQRFTAIQGELVALTNEDIRKEVINAFVKKNEKNRAHW